MEAYEANVSLWPDWHGHSEHSHSQPAISTEIAHILVKLDLSNLCIDPTGSLTSSPACQILMICQGPLYLTRSTRYSVVWDRDTPGMKMCLRCKDIHVSVTCAITDQWVSPLYKACQWLFPQCTSGSKWFCFLFYQPSLYPPPAAFITLPKDESCSVTQTMSLFGFRPTEVIIIFHIMTNRKQNHTQKLHLPQN